jgi:putative component of membrane protein insertase Oxa1/YidC/SpoIIIJ protein YidD
MSGLIRIYQYLRAMKHLLLITVFGYSSVCRHTPSCSQYARQQIADHGTIWGSVKAIIRIAQCW